MVGEERWWHNRSICWRQHIVGWAKRCRFLVQQIRIGRIVPRSSIQAIDERVIASNLFSTRDGMSETLVMSLIHQDPAA